MQQDQQAPNTNVPPEDLAAEARLLARLADWDIPVKLHRHPPVFTVAEAEQLIADIPGGHGKTLFVRDKKKRHALIIADGGTRVALDQLAADLGYGRLSFASAERLVDWLGVQPGSVTPFALINAEADGRDLRVIIDSRVLAHTTLNYHPLHNRATLSIARDDLLRFITRCGYTAETLHLQPGA